MNFMGFLRKKVSPELIIQVFKVAAKGETDKTQKQSQRTKSNLNRLVF